MAVFTNAQRRTAVSTLIALAIILLIGFGWRYQRESVRLRAVVANNARAQELKAKLDRRLAGATETEIVEVLRQEYPGYTSSGTHASPEYWVPVGVEPSSVWYCGSFTVHVRIFCRDGRFLKTDISRWSNDCL